MRKVLSVILSLMILVLSTVSCSDHEDMPVQQNQMETISVGHAPNVAFDLCNPFFFCHTGHSAFVQSDVFVVRYVSSTVHLVSENPVSVDIQVYSLFWHPPKA